MSRLLVFLLLTGFSWQSKPLPDPPFHSPEIAAARKELSTEKDPDKRRAAAERFVGLLLESARSEDLAVYLMDCAGQDLLPVKWEGVWQKLASRWRGSRAFVLGLLKEHKVRPPGRLAGAALAAGFLEMDRPEEMELLAGLLDDPATAFAAQRALYRITRREFPDRAAFDAWWPAAQGRKRVDWILAAEAERTAMLVQVWRQRLAENPEMALEAIQPDQLRGVRSLGYDAMATLAAPEEKPPDSPQAQALIQAFETETMPELRRKILGLVPRFLEGQAALALIDKAMQTSPRFTGERVEAARALALIRPVEVGREGTLHYLQRAFLQDQPLPSGNPETRLELLSSLEVLGVSAGDTEFGTLLLHALAKENDRTVRDKVFSVAGSLGDEGFFDVLLPYARDADRSLADRSAALDALTQLAERVAKPGKVLGLVHVLLGHPDPNLRFRAILAVRRLKDVSSAPVLASRLGKETEEWLVTEILKTLAVIRDPGILDALLAWPIPSARSVRKEVPGVLRFQIGEDAGLLVRAVGVLGGRNDWDLAFPLLEGYRQGGKPPDSPEFERVYTRTLAHWLLQGDLENGREARAADAVERLNRIADQEPANREWPLLLARLETLRDRVREALEAWKGAVGGGAAPLGAKEWPDLLVSLHAAVKAGLRAEGLEVLKEAGEPPEALVGEAGKIQEALRSLPEAAPDSSPPSSPAPAPAGGDPAPPKEKPSPGDGQG